jgi:hypothetical protein
MNCILCLLRPADTKEHRMKGTLYRRIFPDGSSAQFFTNKPTVYKITQGPKSASLKFGRYDLCADCNNAKSQLSDKAFDDLDYSLQQEVRAIKWHDPESLVRTLPAQDKTVKLASTYFAKFLLCKLHDSEFPIPQELRDRFWGKGTGNYSDRLFIEFVKDDGLPKLAVAGPLVPIPRAFLKASRKKILKSGYLAEYYAVSVTAYMVRYVYVFYDNTRVTDKVLNEIPTRIKSESLAEAFKSDDAI